MLIRWILLHPNKNIYPNSKRTAWCIYNIRFCLMHSNFKTMCIIIPWLVIIMFFGIISEKLGLCSGYSVLGYVTFSYTRETNIISSCAENYLNYYHTDKVGDAAVVFRVYIFCLYLCKLLFSNFEIFQLIYESIPLKIYSSFRVFSVLKINNIYCRKSQIPTGNGIRVKER